MGVKISKDCDSISSVKTYCESLVFIRFYGQTNAMKGKMDGEEFDNVNENPKSELGRLLQQLDKEIKMAENDSELEFTERILEIFMKIAEIRAFTHTEETTEQCFQRFIKDAEKFAEIYRKRGKQSESLKEANILYWGTRQQMLFGKVLCDWINRDKETEMETMDPIFGVLLNPTGGRVGPGDTGWIHNKLFDDLGPFAYHSAVHDAFGYLKINHDTGPGYSYLNGRKNGDSNPLRGQVTGLKFWKDVVKRLKPEEAPEEKFILM
ncbi:uncharacterized protein [Clytia hemisphaerica]|uniref:Uncharacterized protein n=1 Tax=Clytia hemisphaerica TaxID=252671 RepID=A0A7M5X2Y9_9CNID